MQKLTRYSPGGYGAMTEDEAGDYVRLSEIEPRIRQAVDNARDSGLFAGSLIAEENAEELAKLRDLLRWRDAEKELPTEKMKCIVIKDGYVETEMWHKDIHSRLDWKAMKITHWRPIGPMPEVKP